MTVLDAIRRECDDAALTGYKQIVHIRVTTDALQGSVTSTPVTPERARTIGRLMAIPAREGTAVVAHPDSTETLLEILMHPADYETLMIEYRAMGGREAPVALLGIPVSR